MYNFHYQGEQLFVENVPVADIAQQFGTPCYIYSRAAIEQQYKAFDQALDSFPHRICYAVKANSNIAILNVLQRLGSGFDIVSGGELARVLAAEGDPQKIIFSGVGKQAEEIKIALQHKIYCFNVESLAELDRLNQRAAELQVCAPIALRINPDIDAGTHPYISTGLKENKFGIDAEAAIALCRQLHTFPAVKLIGISCHIGSQLIELAPFLAAFDRMLALCDQITELDVRLQHIDLGGGLGVRYRTEMPPTIAEYCAAILTKLAKRQLELIIEPGRAIVANAGILLTRIEYIKPGQTKNFAIVDAAMNDLLRPALYAAWQDIIPVVQHPERTEELYDVVGPVCETGDFLGKDRHLKIAENDLLAICSAGAYSFCMSSNYNSRPRVAEVMVDGDKVHLIRRREEIAELFVGERMLGD